MHIKLYLKRGYRKCFVLIFFGITQLLGSTGLYGVEKPKQAVTYTFSGGRFGDNVLAYLHAKWFSYRFGVSLFYKKFPYSDQLCLSDYEIPFKKFSQKNFQRSLVLQEEDNIEMKMKQSVNNLSTLYTIKYFGETSWGQNSPFNVDWEDVHFRAIIKQMISPKYPIDNNIQLPKDCLSVAIHIRTGGNFEPDMHDVWPLKAPRPEFFIEQLRYLYTFLGQVPLYVHIFTDDQHPQRLRKLFAQKLKDLNLKINCSDPVEGWSNRVLEDFFAMTKFDCSIHGDSNFSVCAGLISDYKVEIRPISVKEVGDRIVIDRILMRLHLHPTDQVEYIDI